MNIENARKWVAALRSGTYTQTRGALRRPRPSVVDEAGHCCLGVAHECLIGPLPEDFINEGSFYLAVTAALALDPGCAQAVSDESKFVKMNDEDEKSFSEIADYIEWRIAAQLAREEVAARGF